MCGITGLAFRDPTRMPDTVMLGRMADILRHRGPDSDGFHLAPGVGLGFRRLAIIDLATGEQPIANEDGSVVVVCNGEIYNHVELRVRLVAAGHRFRTASDVETIVHLYEEHGDRFVDHLRGMFAIALWDARRRRMLLARDRFGIKPLYYAVTGDALVFGSEQKAILASGTVTPEPDLQGIRQLLTDGRTVTPRTIVRGIAKVPAETVLAWSCGAITASQYWEVSFPARDDYERRPEREWVEGLRDKLAESVRLHMRSDVPIGAWLSGGIDSSSVAALMAATAADPVKTFTMRARETEFDELRDGRARCLSGVSARRPPRAVRARGLRAAPDVHLAHRGQVLGPIVTGQLRVAQASAEHVKVVMCRRRRRRAARRLFVVSDAARARRGVHASPRRQAVDRRRTRDPQALARRGRHHRRPARDGLRTLLRQHLALRHAVGRRPAVLARRHRRAAARRPGARRDAGTGRSSNLAPVRADAVLRPQAPPRRRRRAQPGRGVDGPSARPLVPDHELAEFCARIPPGVKLSASARSTVAAGDGGRAPARDRLAQEAADARALRPVARRSAAGIRARRELSEARLREAGFFDPGKVAAALELHRARGEDFGHALSAVLGVQLWDRMFRRSALSAPLMRYRWRDFPSMLATAVGRSQIGEGVRYRMWPVSSRLARAYRRTVVRGTHVVAVVGSSGKSTTGARDRRRAGHRPFRHAAPQRVGVDQPCVARHCPRPAERGG